MRQESSSARRNLWAATISVVAGLVAAGGTVILYLADSVPANIIMAAATAFATTTTLCLSVWRLLHP